MSRRAQLVAEFLRNARATRGSEGASEGGLESLPVDDGKPDDRKQHYLESSGANEELVDLAVTALDHTLKGGVPNDEELGALEAIVLKDECPTVAIFEDALAEAPRGRWSRLANDATWLKPVIQAACRVDCSSL